MKQMTPVREKPGTEMPVAEVEVEEPLGTEEHEAQATASAAEDEAVAEAMAAQADAMAEAEADAVKEAFEEAAAAARGPAGSFIERMADRMGMRAGVEAAFGEPIVRGKLTIVPVARVAWGFGGGAGDAPEGAGGSGGGGGSMVRPMGYLEISDDFAEFRPLRPVWTDAPAVLAWAFATWFVLRAVRGLFRR